jgi:threonine synthase
MCRELGVKKVAIAAAGNAAGALSAYAAAAGIEAHVFMPGDAPRTNFMECQVYGAHVTLVDGSHKGKEGWFDLSAPQEPYRIEGEKTMGYEMVEQLGWRVPDAILYPTAGGVGMIAIRKAFEELEQLGWIGARRPRMIAVQAEEVGGFSDEELIGAGIRLAQEKGILVSPEGAACLPALEKLLRTGEIGTEEEVVLFNTGSGLKYLDAYATRFPRSAAGEQDKLGGLITPR